MPPKRDESFRRASRIDQPSEYLQRWLESDECTVYRSSSQEGVADIDRVPVPHHRPSTPPLAAPCTHCEYRIEVQRKDGITCMFTAHWPDGNDQQRRSAMQSLLARMEREQCIELPRYAGQ